MSAPLLGIPERRRSLIELRLRVCAKVAPLTPASASSYYNHSVHRDERRSAGRRGSVMTTPR